MPDEGENSFKMPRASVVHMTSTATRPQHMSQVSITVPLIVIRAYLITDIIRIESFLFRAFFFSFYFHLVRRRKKGKKERGRDGN